VSVTRLSLWHRTDSDLQINLGGSPLVRSDIPLTFDEANDALKLLLGKASSQPANYPNAIGSRRE
jgi:hypothetical protein